MTVFFKSVSYTSRYFETYWKAEEMKRKCLMAFPQIVPFKYLVQNVWGTFLKILFLSNTWAILVELSKQKREFIYVTTLVKLVSVHKSERIK